MTQVLEDKEILAILPVALESRPEVSEAQAVTQQWNRNEAVNESTCKEISAQKDVCLGTRQEYFSKKAGKS